MQRRLDDEGPLAPVEVLRIAVQAASGLAAAHAQGLVHRDVKPANILLEDGVERVKLTDFGLARAGDDASLTRTGVIAGTPQYMSPEQARGESVDQRSDLFSLGSVLYAMCTGRAPFRAETSYGVLRRITDEEPRSIREINPDIPEWLCQIIGKLMSKEPDDRYESARDVAQLLEQCLAHVQQPTAVPLPDSLPTQSSGSRFFSTSAHSLGVIAMIAVFCTSLLGMVLWQAAAPPDIAGKWTGEQWGTVVLETEQPDWYEGSYADSEHAISGTMRLKWSRLERRFNGTWHESEDRFGKLSLRLVGNEIRGARTVDPSSEVDATTPRLAEFSWSRTVATSRNKAATPPQATFGSIIERSILSKNTDAHRLVFYRFKDNKVVKPPFLPKLLPNQFHFVEFTPELRDWIKSEGADVLFHLESERWAMMTLEMQQDFVGQAAEWDTIPAAKVTALFAAKDARGQVRSEVPASSADHGYSGFSSVKAFRTRDDLMGIYQLRAFKDDFGHGVMIRYKRVRKSSLFGSALENTTEQVALAFMKAVRIRDYGKASALTARPPIQARSASE